jgi:hypothetical protein
MLEFVKNKRSIHLQTPGPERKRLCGAWNNYNPSSMPAATDEEIATLALCSKCAKIAKGRTDAPPLPFRLLLTEEDREIAVEALSHYADRYEPREPILATRDKFLQK